MSDVTSWLELDRVGNLGREGFDWARARSLRDVGYGWSIIVFGRKVQRWQPEDI